LNFQKRLEVSVLTDMAIWIHGKFSHHFAAYLSQQ
jgi:hypothetical protein